MKTLVLAAGFATLLSGAAFAQTATPAAPATAPATSTTTTATETTAATTGATGGAFYTLPAPGAAGTMPMSHLASDLADLDVYGANNEKIGEIDDLVVNSDGSIAAAVVEVGTHDAGDLVLEAVAVLADAHLGIELEALEVLLQDEVGHARDRVGAVQRRCAVTQHFDAMQLIVRTNIVAQGIKVSMDDTGKLFGLSTWFLLRIRFAFLQNLLFGPQCHPQTCRATCLRHHRHICETGYVSITART